jgi:hypothetical protein
MARLRRRSALVLIAVVVLAVPAIGSGASQNLPHDVTTSDRGRGLATAAAARWSAQGLQTRARDLRVWDLTGNGEEFFVATGMPRGFTSRSSGEENGMQRIEVSFEVGSRDAHVPEPLFANATAAVAWTWLHQGCFSRISNWAGWIDACYKMHKLTGETNARDFFQLQQYGTVGSSVGQIYDGWLMGQRASNSSAMAWEDWSPRQSKSGPCQILPIEVEALDQFIKDSALFCENWNITKWAEAGKFREQWSCGCIFPFGKGQYATRELNLMQAVSVPNGGVARWVLTAGFTAT